jgi:hypothetical protein
MNNFQKVLEGVVPGLLLASNQSVIESIQNTVTSSFQTYFGKKTPTPGFVPYFGVVSLCHKTIKM